MIIHVYTLEVIITFELLDSCTVLIIFVGLSISKLISPGTQKDY